MFVDQKCIFHDSSYSVSKIKIAKRKTSKLAFKLAEIEAKTFILKSFKYVFSFVTKILQYHDCSDEEICLKTKTTSFFTQLHEIVNIARNGDNRMHTFSAFVPLC